MSRGSGNRQTVATQCTHSPSGASRYARIAGPVPYRRFVGVGQTITPLSTAHEGGVAGVPDVQRIRLPVDHDRGRRYPAHPAGGPLPGPDGSGIVDADGCIIFDDAAS